MLMNAITVAALALVPLAHAVPATLEERCTGPHINQASLSLIEEFEGFRSHPYKDVAGHPTIGYGHLCKRASCSEIPYKIPLSKADAQKLLASAVAVAQNCITNDTKSCVRLNANQYGALVSWAFNEGCGNAKSSTLIKRLNTCSHAVNTIISQELPKWNRAGGHVVAGLTRRRAAEVKLAETPSKAGALPACG